MQDAIERAKRQLEEGVDDPVRTIEQLLEVIDQLQAPQRAFVIMRNDFPEQVYLDRRQAAGYAKANTRPNDGIYVRSYDVPLVSL